MRKTSKDGVAVLLNDCVVEPETLAPMLERLRGFAARYQPHLVRSEQRALGLMYLEGLLSPLERKSIEPIATEHGRPRRALQRFVGAGLWDDEPLMADLRAHVREELGDEEGVLILDPSSFPKKGTESVGVKRQWCGRLGKQDNCQIGVFMSYESSKGHSIVAHRLYLPQEWAEDAERRAKCHVPGEAEFLTTWQIADAQLVEFGSEFPHRYVVADEEFGRIGEFRRRLQGRGEKYMFSVDCTTSFEDLRTPLPKWKGVGRPPTRRMPVQAQAWAGRRKNWKRIWVRDGEQAPIEVHAASTTIEANTQTTIERLVVLRSVGDRPEYRYWVTNDLESSLEDLVRVAARRHWVEHDFQRAKGEVGLDHYEVRSWVGWHHHMTLACLALFFLVLEQRRVGGKNLRSDRPASGMGTRRALEKSAG